MGPGRSDAWRRGLALVLLVTAVAAPLVFVPGWDDGYAFPKVTVLRLAGAIGALVFIGYLAAGGSVGQIVQRPIDLPLATYVGLTALATIASVDIGQSLRGEPFQYQGLVTVVLYVAAFYAARLTWGDATGVQTPLRATVVTGAIVAVYAVAQSLGFDPFWSGPPDDRPISSVGQANDLAAYLDLTVVAAISLYPKSSSRVRGGLIGVVLFSLIALGLSLSRGGFLGLLAALAILLIPGLRREHLPLAHPIVGAAAVLVITLLAGTLIIRLPLASVAERIRETVDVTEGSARMHLALWQVGSAIAIANPVLGTGPETFPLTFRDHLGTIPPAEAGRLRRFRAESPHNELIGIAAETGIPALIAYVTFLLATVASCLARGALRIGSTQGWSARMTLAVLTVHVVTTTFMTPEVSTSVAFWILLGAGLGAMTPSVTSSLAATVRVERPQAQLPRADRAPATDPSRRASSRDPRLRWTHEVDVLGGPGGSPAAGSRTPPFAKP